MRCAVRPGVWLILLACTSLSPLSGGRASAGSAGDGQEQNRYAIQVRPEVPDHEPVQYISLTLWRALEAGEEEPVNRVNGPQGFGLYDPVIWEDQENQARWIRLRTAHPNDGRHGWDTKLFRFTDLPAGKYRVVAVSYRPQERRPDPTPYGVSAPFTLGRDGNVVEQDEPQTIELPMRGIAPLVVRVVDAQSGEPISGLAIRLRAADGMPIVHGHGSGNFFERTSDRGEVYYRRLQPGQYTVQVLGKQARVNEFVQYEPMSEWVTVLAGAGEPTTLEIPVPPRELDAAEIERRFPFYVYGRVTTEEGAPLEKVEVRAATGMGTLLGGGRTMTDADGRYRLYFGPGMLASGKPHGVGLQAALISARKEGWFETQFNQQGDLLMSDQPPEAIEAQIREEGKVWGHTSVEQIVFPGVPRKVNFTMRQAAVIQGKLLANGSRGVEEQQLYLTGDQLPPGSSVLRSLTTGEGGSFQLDAVPLDRPWRFGVRIGGTRQTVETPEFTLTRPGVHPCEVSIDSTRSEDGSLTIRLRYRFLE